MSYLALADGTRLRLCERRGGRRAIVLLHGWRQSHRLFDPAVARLAHSHHVVAYDLRGMGESDKPDSRYDFDEQADDLAAVLDALDLRDATLVGWSMGGSVALSLLARGASRVGRLVLVNSPLRLTRTPDFPHALEPAALDGYIAELEHGWPLHERDFYAASLLDPQPGQVDLLAQVGLQTPLDVALRLVRAQGALDLRGAVTSLAVPVLAAYSRHDPYWPLALAEWIAERAPRGELATFERSGHCPMLEEPDRFCELIDDFADRTEEPP